MKWMIIIIVAMFATGCESLQLKTREDLRNDNSAPKQNPQPASNTVQPPTAVPAPPPEESPDAQMRDLNGRVDEAEHQVQLLSTTLQASKDDATKQAQLRDQKITALEDEIKKLEAQVQTLSDQVNKPKAVVAAEPGTYISDGDDLSAQKKYKEAIVSYQKYRDAMPKGNRYAEATYKIGLSFQELGMKDESKAFLEEVIGKFPKSQYAKSAAKKLKHHKK